MKNIVVGLGEALWDLLPEGKKLGGAPANFAYNVSQLGIESYVVSAVGNDVLGKEILEVFDSKNMKYIINRVDKKTGSVNVELDSNGIPSYEIIQDVAWDNMTLTDEIIELASKTTAVCFGSLAQRGAKSRKMINGFIDAMPNNDKVLKIFDINLRQNYFSKDIVVDSLKRCNVLKINDEELIVVSHLLGYITTEPDHVCRQLIKDYNLKMLILTCGTKGSSIYYDNEISFMDTPKVKVADTVGAGDSFTAAFCVSILNGKSIKEAHKNAVQVSAYICTCAGAMPLLPKSFVDAVNN
ncbi:MAG: carbohydrate kinase [Bacteroidales bacterium]|nr:carbohydrate kinase [Bacteroidales bacterium]